ncbi:Haloacid dehalogenase [Bordetella sputigena]|uniref:HAD family hydrolase n=1 Tax=Bordetella sputigena TaxID=1416810 RepID=UPI0039EE7646
MSTHFAFDLDGTVTTQELLPAIANHLGLRNEMRLLTELTLSGHIDFESSFRLRCAILQSVPISDVQSIVAEVPLHGEIAAFIMSRRQQCSVVTGNLDVWIEPLISRLGCSVFCSSALTDGNRLIRPQHVLHKSKPIRELQARGCKVVAVGDSVNDIPMFEVADVGIAFGGVHEPAHGLAEIADYLTFDGGALCRLLRTL